MSSRRGPVGPEFVYGLAHRLESTSIDTAPTVSSFAGLRKQLGVNEDANVFRDGRLANLKLRTELRDSAPLPGGQAQNLAARFARQSTEQTIESLRAPAYYTV